MKHKLLLIIALYLVCNYSFGQSSLEGVKKSIRSYLYQNLNDFKSYEPIGYSELKKLNSTIEDDADYQKYFEYFNQLNIEQIQLKSDMNTKQSNINSIQEEQTRYFAALKETSAKKKALVNTDSINYIKKIDDMKQELEDLKQDKPIRGQEYLRENVSKRNWKKIEDPIRNQKIGIIEAYLKNTESDKLNWRFDCDYCRRNTLYAQDIKSLNKSIDQNNSELLKKKAEIKVLEDKYSQNENDLLATNNKLSEIKASFKSVQTGFYICHQFRAKNKLGAFVNSTKCFETDNSYNITNVYD